jgi:hypothetical protein
MSYLLEDHKNTPKYEGKTYMLSLLVQLQMDFVKLCNYVKVTFRQKKCEWKCIMAYAPNTYVFDYFCLLSFV